MKRTVCVIDDEFRSRKRVLTLLEENEDFVVVGEADNGKAAVELIDAKLPDIVILDINMPGLSGFQVLENTTHKPAVIFITAFDEHAVRAFDINAIDYVLKPYQDYRLLEALSRVPEGSHLETETLQDIKQIAEDTSAPKTYFKRISVKDRFEFRVIDVENIDFFHTEDNLVFLHTNGLHFIIDKSLSQLEESLNPEVFFRAHRKSLVNLNRIERVIPWGRGRYALTFAHDGKVHLSKDKTRELKHLLGMY